MKKSILTINLIVFMSSFVVAQEFAPVVMNPFGLQQADPENSAFHVKYADMDGDNDLDAVHFGLIEDTFYLSIQPNIGSVSSPNFGPHERNDLLNTFDLVLIFPDMADINQDGLIDIFAFGAIDSLEGYTSVYFKNITTGNKLAFERTRVDAIGLPAVGDGFFVPELIDLNLDGDLDVLYSGLFNNLAGDETDGVIYYGQHLGDVNDPMYSGWYENPYGISFQDTFQLALSTAGDLDNDGDIDILSLIAETDEISKYYYFENIAGIGNRPAYDQPLISAFNLVDSFGLPDLVDIDDDGDLDLFLFMGENGVAFFENISCAATTTQLNKSICDGESIQVGTMTFNSTGNYQVNLTNLAGCDSTIELNLTVTTINANISLNDMTLSAENVSASMYQWIDCNTNLAIDGATGFSFTPSQSGSYAVQIYNNDCMTQSECQTVMISSIKNIDELGIMIYPNPADDKISLDGVNQLDVREISLVNLIGQTYHFNKQQAQLDISMLPSGIYFIQLLVNDQIYISPIAIH